MAMAAGDIGGDIWVDDPEGDWLGDFTSGRCDGWLSLDDQQEVLLSQGWRRFHKEKRQKGNG
jgi:hypothetical protein